MSTKTVLATLKAARRLITPKKAWTQGANAKGKSGRTVHTNSRYAVCFCANGAIWEVSRSSELFWDSLASLRIHAGGSIPEFNDTHTHAEVLAAFDAAIAAEKAKAR